MSGVEVLARRAKIAFGVHGVTRQCCLTCGFLTPPPFNKIPIDSDASNLHPGPLFGPENLSGLTAGGAGYFAPRTEPDSDFTAVRPRFVL